MDTILLTIGASLDSAFHSFDMWVFHFFGSMQNTFLTYVAKFFTTFGDENFVIPMAIFAVVLCLFKKTRKFGFTLLFAIAIGTIITNVVVKPMALRIRPYNSLQGPGYEAFQQWYQGAGALSESDYSFPSGHTTGITEICLSLFLCFKSEKKKIGYVFPFIALCTGGSRIYLMVHYCTDVIGGLIVGSFAAVAAYFLAKLAIMLLKKIKLDDVIDLGRLFEKMDGKLKAKINPIIIVVAVCVIFLQAFIPSLSEGNEQRCAYEDDSFKCYNEARVDDEKYPAIDGKEYCKIHWKQLMGVNG